MNLETPSQKKNPFKVLWMNGDIVVGTNSTLGVSAGPYTTRAKPHPIPPDWRHFDYTLDLVPGAGDTDNARFSIPALPADQPTNHWQLEFNEGECVIGTFEVRVRLTHKPSGEFKEAALTIEVGDDVAPTITSFSIPATGTSYVLTGGDITFSVDDNVGVTHHLIKETNTPPLANDAGWKVDTFYAANGYTIQTQTGSGVYTLYLFVKDAAGNVSDVASDTITLTIA